ncbi:MAG: hypothetical protein AAGL99_02755 [Pseudomonadota bacterium]
MRIVCAAGSAITALKAAQRRLRFSGLNAALISKDAEPPEALAY